MGRSLGVPVRCRSCRKIIGVLYGDVFLSRIKERKIVIRFTDLLCVAPGAVWIVCEKCGTDNDMIANITALTAKGEENERLQENPDETGRGGDRA